MGGLDDFSGFEPMFLDFKSSALSITLSRSRVMDPYSGSSAVHL